MLTQTMKIILELINETDDKQAKKTYSDINEWLRKLFRFELFLSEYVNEYELSDKEAFTKEEILEFLKKEMLDWNLDIKDIG